MTGRDNSAEKAAQQRRAEEEARQGKINQGRSSIDQQFSQFNDPYFEQRQTEYTDYYKPQLEDQYNDALEKSRLYFADRGGGRSSAAIRQTNDLLEEFNRQRQAIIDNASAYSNRSRASVEDTRNSLYNQLQSSADPAAAAASAASQSQILNQPEPFSPLGQVFADFTSTLQQNQLARGNAINPRSQIGTSNDHLVASGVNRGGASYFVK